MNSVYMRALSPNIYIYMRRNKCTKNPLKKYNNRKDYYTSNTNEECSGTPFDRYEFAEDSNGIGKRNPEKIKEGVQLNK
jgi:hypothetical protein